MKAPEELINDSLGGVDDISLRFSTEGDFTLDAISQMNTMKGRPSVIYSPGRRQMLFVIAVDSYHDNGNIKENLNDIIKNVIKAAVLTLGKGKIGFVLASGSSLQEIVKFTQKNLINLKDFDAIVCNSGSEVYYPWRDMVVDVDYEIHVEYKWLGESIRSVILRLACTEPETDDGITEYASACSSRCYAVSVKQGIKTRRVDDLRQRLRMRALRCNIFYTHAATRLNVIPLCASRIQALRYLSIRWGIDMSKTVFFLGEKGDTDYEDLLGGLHKTIILKGSVGSDSEKLLRSEEKKFIREDAVLQDSPNINYVKENGGPQKILSTLEAYGFK